MQPTPVFLPGESHGQRSLPIVHRVTESDKPEHLSTHTRMADSLCCAVGTNTAL